ncbi:MAG: MFS transporter, partial [Microthrixaceae bacterium]|nr:MFS transporter [Microthrixaceae bacterium]
MRWRPWPVCGEAPALVLVHDLRIVVARNFRLFFVGQGVSQIGNWMTLVTQTLLVLELTRSGIALGLLAAAQFAPVLLFGPLAGLVADRSDKRRLLMVVQSIAMVQSLSLAVLAFGGRPPVWSIYALAAVGGFTVAFDNPTRRSLVVEMVDEAMVPNAVALNTTMMTSSRIFGPALAGVLVATVGFGAAFLVDGLSYVAVLVSLAMIRPAELRPAVRPGRGPGQIREGIRYVRGEPNLFVPMVMMAVIGTLAFNHSTVLPLFAVRDLHGSDATYTLLFSVLSVGALVGSLVAARRASVGGANGRLVRGRVRGFDVRPRALTRAPGRSRSDGRLGWHERGVPDGIDRDRAVALAARDAWPGARAAGDAVPRFHSDRRADRSG